MAESKNVITFPQRVTWLGVSGDRHEYLLPPPLEGPEEPPPDESPPPKVILFDPYDHWQIGPLGPVAEKTAEVLECPAPEETVAEPEPEQEPEPEPELEVESEQESSPPPQKRRKRNPRPRRRRILDESESD